MYLNLIPNLVMTGVLVSRAVIPPPIRLTDIGFVNLVANAIHFITEKEISLKLPSLSGMTSS